MCSLQNEMRVFRPQVPSKAVRHNSVAGPNFTPALAVYYKMNDEDNGLCRVRDSKYDYANYCVETDAQGNSVLTGDGGKNNNGDFTCTGLEVFLIE